MRHHDPNELVILDILGFKSLLQIERLDDGVLPKIS